MIKTAADAVIQALSRANIKATIDARNLPVPGGFVTVTKILKATLVDEWAASGEITVVVPDHGGAHDITALDAVLCSTVDALLAAGVEITEITTNEQVTPPTGGKLPAATIHYIIYV